MDNSEKLIQFNNITSNVNNDTATFYLETSNWNLETAMDRYYQDKQNNNLPKKQPINIYVPPPNNNYNPPPNYNNYNNNRKHKKKCKCCKCCGDFCEIIKNPCLCCAIIFCRCTGFQM
eukprot:TRINITY_DN3201_c0_g1_i1.p1 TRINITY_DN3201_c0_g1~~TRINITY_DN3201_c0_g1_i1.p1  ORF type:complete len:118 (+),score=23.25 TRINITY_DN3201_c0_g1_i1:417-770(+)